MTLLHGSSDAAASLVKALGLPKHTKSLDLHLAAGEIASVRCTLALSEEAVAAGLEELQTYNLAVDCPPVPLTDQQIDDIVFDETGLPSNGEFWTPGGGEIGKVDLRIAIRRAIAKATK